MTLSNIERLWGALESDNRFRIWIKDGQLGVKAIEGAPCTYIDPEKLSTEDVDTIMEVLAFKRTIKVLDIMARIVGYYSLMSGWNNGKLGEAIDRRKGDYMIGGLAV